jgi:predicted ATPase
MIKSVYIDNYKCFVNAEINLRALNLFLGDNGTGKTALFEALSILKALVIDEQKIDALLPASTLTRWQQRSIQTFEINLHGNGGDYQYKLEVDHLTSDTSEDKRRIKLEKLTFNDRPLFEFKLGDVQLYRDDFSEGPAYPFDWGRSALATIMAREENRRLTWFKQRLSQVYVLRIDPFSMSGQSEKESSTPTSDLSNFVSWYRHLSQENPNRLSPLFESLGQAIDGFNVLKLSSEGGETRTMKMSVDHQADNFSEEIAVDYAFDELSEGQRSIIALHSILHFTLREDVTLCIDEPENYLALSEIQPWLMDLAEACDDEDAQAVLISHHPEFINLLALEKGTLFERPNAGPVRTHPLDVEQIGDLSLSEFVARGWHNE